MAYKLRSPHTRLRHSICYFDRRIPSDLQSHCRYDAYAQAFVQLRKWRYADSLSRSLNS